MEQITFSVSLEFAEPLTREQIESLKDRVRSFVENESLDEGQLSSPENEVTDFSIDFDDE